MSLAILSMYYLTIKQIGLFTAILFAVSTLMMACKAEVHTHTFAEEWRRDKITYKTI